MYPSTGTTSAILGFRGNSPLDVAACIAHQHDEVCRDEDGSEEEVVTRVQFSETQHGQDVMMCRGGGGGGGRGGGRAQQMQIETHGEQREHTESIGTHTAQANQKVGVLLDALQSLQGTPRVLS